MNRLVTALVVVCVLSLLSCNEANLTAPELDNEGATLAKKGGNPGGGGPGGEEPTPPGVIYAFLNGDRVTMDGDGNVLGTLSADAIGSPSHEIHGDERWFLFTTDVEGVYPDSTQRRALVAACETGDHRVDLINDPLFHPMGSEVYDQPRWSPTPADSLIAFTGRRFISSTAAASEGGIYVADVSFDGDRPELVQGSLSLEISGDMVEDPSRCTTDGVCYARSDVFGPEWSPDSTRRLAFIHRDLLTETPELYIFVDGERQFVTSDAFDPRWSSQDLILFRRTVLKSTLWTQLVTVSPDGLGENVLVTLRDQGRVGWAATVRKFRGYFWSPDGAYFVYGWSACELWECTEFELVRRKADGSAETVLAKPDWAVAQGWR